MSRYINKHWWKPLLRLDIAIPFVQIRTELMNESIDNAIIRYIMLYIQVWKWHFDFRLYNTWERIADGQRS